MKESTSKALNELNATVEELSAFEWYTGDSRNKTSIATVEAAFYIGKFMVKMSKKIGNQKKEKSIREQYFVGKGLPLSRNDYSGCKQIAINFENLEILKVAWAKTGSVSTSPSRIWATLNKKEPVEKTVDEKIDALIKMVTNGSTGAQKKIDNDIEEFSSKLEKYQMLEIALSNQMKMVKEKLGTLKGSDNFKALVKEVAEQPSEMELIKSDLTEAIKKVA